MCCLIALLIQRNLQGCISVKLSYICLLWCFSLSCMAGREAGRSCPSRNFLFTCELPYVITSFVRCQPLFSSCVRRFCPCLPDFLWFFTAVLATRCIIAPASGVCKHEFVFFMSQNLAIRIHFSENLSQFIFWHILWCFRHFQTQYMVLFAALHQ